MQFRCPYCKADIGPVAKAKCPKCGHVMVVKSKSDSKDRKARRRKIEAIRADAERKKLEIAGYAPSIPRGPKFYLIAIFAFSALLFVALKYSTHRDIGNGNVSNTSFHINILAEALGRFKFHTGVYPTTEQGLNALTWIETGRIPGYDGPYLMQKVIPGDAWETPYKYTGVGDDPGDPLPTLVSAGPDRKFGTEDDIYPDPECFYRAGRDTSWTNEWVPYIKRGPRILSKEQKAVVEATEARLRKRAEEKAAADAAAAAAERPAEGGAGEETKIENTEEEK